MSTDFQNPRASARGAVKMVGFIGHSTEDLIRSMGAKLIRVSGGMPSLRNELTRLYVEN